MKKGILILLLAASVCTSGQGPDLKAWIKLMQDQSDQQVLNSEKVTTAFLKLDTLHAIPALKEMETMARNDAHAQARLWALEARYNFEFRMVQPFNLKPCEDLFERSLNKAMEIDDELLIAEICTGYSLFCNRFALYDKAMFYTMKSLELREKNGHDKFGDPSPFYLLAADILYKVGEYDLCKQQILKALASMRPRLTVRPLYPTYNTLALAYQKLAVYDSALYWYRTALPFTDTYKDTAWKGIITGNIGQVFFLNKKYDSAKYYLLRETALTRNTSSEKASPSNSLLLVARILVLEKKTDSALLLIRQAEPFLHDPYYNDRRNIYKAKAELFAAMNVTDSAAYFSDLYQHQDDSIKAKLVKSKMDVTLIKLKYEKSQHDISQIIKERKREHTMQLLLVAGIVLIIAVGLFIYRQQQQKNKLEKQVLTEQKKNAEEISGSAQKQLELFTKNIIEKNEMIEKLQQQLAQHDQQLNNDLVSQTILTDDDWNRFRIMFSKARPGFFEQVRSHAPDITPAELRLAALLSLDLDTKNIASMLGISSDAVRKSKSRLRQRLNITVEEDIEQYIKKMADNS